jgi:SAM-dependent methyltransferase
VTWRSGRYRVGRLGLWRSLTPLVPLAPDRGARAVDVGCGVRPFDLVLRRRGYRPIGVDANAGTADVLGLLPHLPFHDAAFPLALCINVLQYVEDPVAACRELFRIVRPGGSVLIVVPHCLPLGSDDYWRWTEHAAGTLLEDGGFEPIAVVPILPTVAIQSHLLALSARKAFPMIGRVGGAGLDLVARAALRSGNVSLTGGYAIRGVKPS